MATVLNSLRSCDIARAYDEIAPVYDALFRDDQSHQENEAIMARLGDLSGLRVLDIGCGTGLLLEYADPAEYVGVDPSPRMLAALRRKFPQHSGDLRCATLEEALPDLGGFDLAVALFGVGSYLTMDELQAVPGLAQRSFVMGYWPGYVPVTYERSGVYVPTRSVWVPLGAEHWGNYWIVATP